MPPDDATEDYIDGYTDALQDVADGCFETIAEVKGDNDFDDGAATCEQCGAELVQQMGSEDKICPSCEP